MNGQPTSGDILGQTFSLYFRKFGLYFATCAVVLAIPIALQIYGVLESTRGGSIEARDPAAFDSGFGPTYLIGTLIAMVGTYLAIAAMVYGVFQQVRGKSATVGECLSHGLRRFVPVLLVSVIVGVLTFVGAMLCIVPGIIVYVFLAMAVPAIVIERGGVFGSLSRSTQLGENYRWTVFGVLFGLGLLMGVFNFVLGMVFAMISPLLWVTVSSLFTVVWTGLQATAVTLLYYNLRRQKESVDADQIAEVFA